MMGKESNGRISEETFDDFLAGQGLLEDAEEIAIKRVLAWQIGEAMKAQGLTKTAMAALMRTDRPWPY
jgi:antitoxin HicB